MRRSDAAALVELARREIPPDVATVLPPERGQFLLPPLVTTGLESDTEAWVLDDGAGPRMFVRATASRAMAAGHLTGPIIAPEVPTDRAAKLVGQVLDWLAAHGVPRVLAEVADHNRRGSDALEASGFVTDAELATETLYLRLDA